MNAAAPAEDFKPALKPSQIPHAFSVKIIPPLADAGIGTQAKFLRKSFEIADSA
jgi:hypothetical protein